MINYAHLNDALKDGGIQLKHLSTEDYLETMKLMRQLFNHFEEVTKDVQTTVNEYNKEYDDRVKKIREAAGSKKTTKLKDEELSAEDKAFLETKPPVTINKGLLRGPLDFIEKVNKIQAREPKKLKLNFLSDAETFKKVVENANSENQLVLYENLFKK